MDFISSLTSLLTISLVLIVLFILPFLPLFYKLFKNEPAMLKVFMSLATGISLSAFIVITLAFISIYNWVTFTLVYLIIISIAYLIVFRINSINTLEDLTTQFKLKAVNKIQSFYTVITLKNAKGYIFHNFLILVIISLTIIIGIYTRFGYSFSNVALPSIDPYGHLLVTKVLSEGILYSKLGFYDDYPRGFHSIVSLIHFYSGLDAYTTMRYLGGLIGFISIGSIYCFVSKIKDKLAGAFAALLYSGIMITGEMRYLIIRQIQPIPEVMGYLILPIVLVFAYNLFSEKSKLDTKNLILLTISTSALFLIHPYTAMMCLYLVFLMAVIFSIQQRNFRYLLIITAIGVIPVLITFTPFVQNFFTYGGSWTETFKGLFTFKIITTPTILDLMIISLAVLISIYGFVARKTGLIFIGCSAILFAFIYFTGFLTIAKYPASRVIPFYGLTMILVLGAVFSEIFYKLNEFTLYLGSQLKNLKYRRFIVRFASSAKTFAAFVIVIYLMIFLPKEQPALSPFQYGDAIEAALEISSEYPMDQTVIYSERVFLLNTERAIIEPEGMHYELHDLLTESPENITSGQKYTFIFIDKGPFLLRTASNYFEDPRSNGIYDDAEEWIFVYQREYDDITVYYESRNIVIYKIMRA